MEQQQYPSYPIVASPSIASNASVPSNNTMTSIEIASVNTINTPSTMHERRATINTEGSMFVDNELKWAWAWLSLTALYWTLLIWIPIISTLDFGAGSNIGGLIIWCFGCIGMISTAYTLNIGHLPSGATKENKFAMDGIGRWTAAILTSCVIIDCFVLVYISVVDLDEIDAADNIIYNTNLSRLVLHIVSIFWSSLFYYNRFKTFHKSMAIRAFILEWTDIIWSCIVSFIITEPQSVDIIYFLIVGVQLIGWMAPMMFHKKWGTTQYGQTVAVHLLLLDLCTDAPVIMALLITQAYQNNVILWIDIIWKSFLIQRSVSAYFVKYYLNRKSEHAQSNAEPGLVESSMIYGISFEAITFVWLLWVGLYWNICVLIRCVLDNEITLNYEYYTWFLGMIGIFCIFDACLAGYSAETNNGKAFIAYTCLLISIDCILHAYELLAGIDDKDDIVGELMMIFHCISLIASILFYSNSFAKGIGYSFVVQWVDIALMFVVIEILNSNLIGDCLSKALCLGYFVVFTIKIIFWFTPIIFGYANHNKGIHIHMVLLDTFTDLPLVFIIILTEGYRINPFVFVDIVFKVFVLLFSYSYHLVINLILVTCTDNIRDNDNDP